VNHLTTLSLAQSLGWGMRGKLSYRPRRQSQESEYFKQKMFCSQQIIYYRAKKNNFK